MFHRISFVVVALLLGMLAAGSQAEGVQRGKVKALDVENYLIVITIEGKDHELTLTDATQVPGGQGKDLAAKLRGFREGTEVYLKAVQRGGRQVVLGMRRADTSSGTEPRAGEGDGRQFAQGIKPDPWSKPQMGSDAGPQQAKIKEIDVEGRSITLIVGGKEVTLPITDQTQLRGARGETRVDQLKSFEPGSDVMFLAADREGRKVLLGLASAAGKNASANPRRQGGQPASPDHSALKPLDELGINKHQGHVGGLYPQGRNTRPGKHEEAGLKLAAQVQPRDAEGKPDPAGKIVLLSIGISNAEQSSQGFQNVLAGYDQKKNPRLVFVNGAGAMPYEAVRSPDDGDQGTRYWNKVEWRLKQARATPAQVQAIWIKIAWPGPSGGFPEYAKRLQSEMTRLVQILPQRFPNAKLAYLSSRTYGGFGKTSLNPEPYAYESGFSVKWLIEEQIKGSADLNYDAATGAVKSPWLSWGPYLWANGQSKRSGDGLSWEQSDFTDDGTHLSIAGQRKVGQLLLDFFKSDSTTRDWFNRR
jgi:hypothetical protein